MGNRNRHREWGTETVIARRVERPKGVRFDEAISPLRDVRNTKQEFKIFLIKMGPAANRKAERRIAAGGHASLVSTATTTSAASAGIRSRAGIPTSPLVLPSSPILQTFSVGTCPAPPAPPCHEHFRNIRGRARYAGGARQVPTGVHPTGVHPTGVHPIGGNQQVLLIPGFSGIPIGTSCNTRAAYHSALILNGVLPHADTSAKHSRNRMCNHLKSDEQSSMDEQSSKLEEQSSMDEQSSKLEEQSSMDEQSSKPDEQSSKMYSVLVTRYSVLGTRYSLLGTRYSVLATRYSLPDLRNGLFLCRGKTRRACGGLFLCRENPVFASSGGQKLFRPAITISGGPPARGALFQSKRLSSTTGACISNKQKTIHSDEKLH